MTEDDFHTLVLAGASDEALRLALAFESELFRRQAAQAFDEAMAKAQGEMRNVFKGSTAKGASFNYAYAGVDAVLDNLRTVLPKHGFSWAWAERREGDSLSCTCTLRHVGGASKDDTQSSVIRPGAGLSDEQAVGKTSTYLRRYTLLGVTGNAATGDDSDGAPAVPEKHFDPSPIHEAIAKALAPDDLVPVKAMIQNAPAEVRGPLVAAWNARSRMLKEQEGE